LGIYLEISTSTARAVEKHNAFDLSLLEPSGDDDDLNYKTEDADADYEYDLSSGDYLCRPLK